MNIMSILVFGFVGVVVILGPIWLWRKFQKRRRIRTRNYHPRRVEADS